MSPGLGQAVQFAATVPGSILLVLGHVLVLVCLCSDMARLLSVRRSRRRYIASTVFRTLVLPAIVIMAVSVVLDAAAGAWADVALGTAILMTVILRWRNDTDEDNWWTGKGKALGRWLRNQTAPRSAALPAAA